ncbi:MAG: SDR family oxidoreductase [Pseudomonadota bacterium]
MDLGIRGKIALVTGGSSGIGLAAAVALAREGAQIVLASRAQDRLDRAASRLCAEGAEGVTTRVVDVSDLDALQRCVEEVVAAHDGVDILINNAGGPAPGPLKKLGRDAWESAWRLSLMSVVEASRAVLPEMTAKGWGRIVNITSVVAKEPSAVMVLSATYRAGVMALTKAVAGEVAGAGVTVNAVCPSAVLTDRARQLISAGADQDGRSFDDALAQVIESLPMKRFAREEEIGDLVAYLCSRQAAYVTGRSISIDGGSSKSFL